MFPVLPDRSALPHNAFIATVRVASALHKHLITLGFVGLYVALDAASFIHPLHGLNITPWNPAPALGLVFLLRRGPGARPVLVAAVLLSEYLVRGVPFPWWDSLLSALILAAGYLLLTLPEVWAGAAAFLFASSAAASAGETPVRVAGVHCPCTSSVLRQAIG